MEMNSLPLPNYHTLEVSSLPTKSVIVYADRAEVKRLIKLEHTAPGLNTITIHNISPVIERQSIKVEGHKGATILSVDYEETPLPHDPAVANRSVLDLEEEKVAAEAERRSLEDVVHVLRKRLEVLDGVADQIGQNVLVSADIEAVRKHHSMAATSPASAFLLCNEAMTNLSAFLDYYSKTANDMRQELRDKEKELFHLQHRLDAMERELDHRRCKSEYDTHHRRITIVIDVEVDGSDEGVEIALTYLVYCVSWRPAYDLRATTSSSALTSTNNNNKVSILYYGLVEQKTEEDWREAEVTLSTAIPCLAGMLPTVPTLTAGFHPRQQPCRQRNYSSRYRKPISNGSREEEDIGIGSYDYNECTDAAAFQHRLTMTTTNSSTDNELAQIPEHLPSTHFPVSELATILCNGQNHKVLIAKVELEHATFTHEAIPSRTASAFVSMTTVNSSTYPFLRGPISIFLNNSFVSTTHLKRSILPSEEFHCLLGVDHSVKIAPSMSRSNNEQVGFMSKSNLSTHEQSISIRNTRCNDAVKLTVREPFPRPIDDKIKITVISPDLKSSRSEARLTKDGHLEWNLSLQPGEQRDLLIKWTVEFPQNECLVYSMIHPTNGGNSPRNI